ncbi:MAG: toll/interleukin-1 receptor domain-containing protein [Lachnospiraceae bacterium]|nr:toll/interleukin-1 receptor domain-containing protein [Lachnospiraceae bacterium]
MEKHIFISYSSKDSGEAFKACEVLEANGKKCFIAPRDIQMGKEYAEEIVNGIDHSQAVILFLTKNANHSPHVLREIERAVSKNIPILVCKLEEVEMSKSMEYFLMTHQWVNVKHGMDYAQLIDALENLTAPRNEKTVTKKKKSWHFVALLIAIPVLMGIGILIGMSLTEENSGKTDFDKVQTGKADDDKEQTIIEVGDTLTFGTYNDEPIEWRVLKMNEDGSAVLISSKILTMKAFDVAESGGFGWFLKVDENTDENELIQAYGNNDWSKSNIRTWLNSEKEVVTYSDEPPRASAMAEKTNGYHNEPGFLYYFTEEEIGALLETESKDRVFLLSLEELKWFDEAGISKLAIPTEKAIEKDQSNWYLLDVDNYGVKEYTWWLREPVANSPCECYVVGNGYREENLFKEKVGLEGFGIRPAIMVDLSYFLQ